MTFLHKSRPKVEEERKDGAGTASQKDLKHKHPHLLPCSLCSQRWVSSSAGVQVRACLSVAGSHRAPSWISSLSPSAPLPCSPALQAYLPQRGTPLLYLGAGGEEKGTDILRGMPRVTWQEPREAGVVGLILPRQGRVLLPLLLWCLQKAHTRQSRPPPPAVPAPSLGPCFPHERQQG